MLICQSADKVVDFMKNFFNFVICFSVLCFGFGCKENPLSEFTQSKYNCTMGNDPEPKTSEEFFARAQKHIEIYSGGGATSLDDCAFAALDEAIRLDPKNVDALRVRGYGYRQKNQYDSALADYGKALEIAPADSRIYFLRSKVYVEQKDYDKALADLSDVIRLEPDDKDAYSERAEIYRKLGKNDLAEADDKKYRELSGYIETVKTTPIGTSNNSGSVKTISGGVINGKAINLVKPEYPSAAKAVRASGAVNVQVTVDENGDVISATAVSGHALLKSSAVKAAKESKFNPTMLSGQKVRVSGIIVYNFTTE